MKRIDVSRRFGVSGASLAIALVCCLLGVASIYIVSRRYGLGVSIDGVIYLNAARQVLGGNGVNYVDGNPLVLFPPLFPLLMAAIGTLVSSVESAARIVQMTLFAGNYLLAASLLARYVQHRLLLPAFLVLFLVSRTFLLYHYYVLTEALYVFLTLGMLILLDRWVEERKSGLIVLASTLAALSCLTRYVGVANILAGALVIVWSVKRRPEKAKSAGLFVTVATIPLLLWLARNILVGGSLTGDRPPSPYPLVLNLQLAADCIALWFVPGAVHPSARVTLVVAAAIGCVFALVRMARHPAFPSSSRVVLLGSVILAHLFVLIAATTLFASDHINTRFVMPLYVPLVIVIALTMSWLVQRSHSSRPFVFAVLAIWMFVQAFTATRSILTREQNGVGGFATRDWHESKVMEFVQKHPNSLSTNAYSNADFAVFYRTGRLVNLLPDRVNPRWSEDYPREALADRPTIDDVRALVDDPDRSVTLIWFDAATQNQGYEAIYLFNQYELEDIVALFRTVPKYEAEDGGVYQLKARSSSHNSPAFYLQKPRSSG